MGDERINLAAEFNIPCPENLDQNDWVLLVDDQQDMRLIVVHHLQKLGYRNILQATSGLEALNILESHSKGAIGAIICSMEMPTMSGLDFLQEIKEVPRYQRGPFAMSLASPSKEKIMYATENGVDEILVKPFTLKDIMPKLHSAFKKFHNPYNPEKAYELAKKFYREGFYAQSEQIYKRISEIAAQSARPVVGLARIAMKKNENDRAMKLVDEALARNPHYVHAYVTRGEILIEQKKPEAAVKEFVKAIEMSPLNPARYEGAAKIFFDLNRHQEAIDLLSLAVKNNLNFPSLHHYLSQGYYALKDYKKALRHIRSALNADPENVTYLNQLGISYKESGMVEDATKVYNQIIKLDPENKAALYNKAVLLHSTGNIEESLKILQRVTTKYPDFGPAKTKLVEYQKEKDAGKKAG